MVLFTWRHINPNTTGMQLWGSFNDWQYGFDMVDGEIDLQLDEGIYEYKFKVDNNWFYDMTKPNTGSPNFNNIKVVENENIVTIVHISDTHSKYFDNLPEGDIFIHTGDFSIGGHYREYEIFDDWIKKFDFKHKVMVLGNHDLDYQLDQNNNPYDYAINKFKNIQVISGHINIMDINFYGIHWDYNHNWDYTPKNPYNINHFPDIPKNMNIVLSHGPSYGKYGSYELLNNIISSGANLHLHGHIHYLNGVKKYMNKYFVNSSSVCEDSTEIINKPRVIKYDKYLKKVISIA